MRHRNKRYQSDVLAGACHLAPVACSAASGIRPNVRRLGWIGRPSWVMMRSDQHSRYARPLPDRRRDRAGSGRTWIGIVCSYSSAPDLQPHVQLGRRLVPPGQTRPSRQAAAIELEGGEHRAASVVALAVERGKCQRAFRRSIAWLRSDHSRCTSRIVKCASTAYWPRRCWMPTGQCGRCMPGASAVALVQASSSCSVRPSRVVRPPLLRPSRCLGSDRRGASVMAGIAASPMRVLVARTCLPRCAGGRVPVAGLLQPALRRAACRRADQLQPAVHLALNLCDRNDAPRPLLGCVGSGKTAGKAKSRGEGLRLFRACQAFSGVCLSRGVY
ncbi:hypothetical protein SAMN05428989_4115 [Pseudoxanthomonas sp. GM95]|nr:hypothetical protein SAMN05428989_4115 [Pseudoxanthomonas sp. GM95]